MLLGGSLFYGREADASGLCRAKPSLRVPSGTGLPPGVASAVRLYEAAVLGERREAELSLRVEQQVEKLRLKESREPPPPRAVRGAARHTKVGLFFAKLPLAEARCFFMVGRGWSASRHRARSEIAVAFESQVSAVASYRKTHADGEDCARGGENELSAVAKTQGIRT